MTKATYKTKCLTRDCLIFQMMIFYRNHKFRTDHQKPPGVQLICKSKESLFKLELGPFNLSSTAEGVEGPKMVQALPTYHGSRVKDFLTWQLHDSMTFASCASTG